VLIQLKAVKSEFLSTVEAQKDVEHCTHDAGILLLDAESKVKDTHLEIERLEEQKNQLKAIVRDIEDVIRAKDEEFQILELKIEQATHWYVLSVSMCDHLVCVIIWYVLSLVCVIVGMCDHLWNLLLKPL